MSPEPDEVSMCIDCAVLAANGELAADRPSDHPEPLSRVVAGCVLVGEAEPHFSWAPCDTCGLALGGDRIDGVVLDPRWAT
jgi:hypothetical protein